MIQPIMMYFNLSLTILGLKMSWKYELFEKRQKNGKKKNKVQMIFLLQLVKKTKKRLMQIKFLIYHK